MKINLMSGAEYINQVREFLESQGFSVDDSEYPIRISNANAGSVWVRAEHKGRYFGHMALSGLWTSLSRNAPEGWSVKRADWLDQSKANVYMVTLPKVEPIRTYDIKG